MDPLDVCTFLLFRDSQTIFLTVCLTAKPYSFNRGNVEENSECLMHCVNVYIRLLVYNMNNTRTDFHLRILFIFCLFYIHSVNFSLLQ